MSGCFKLRSLLPFALIVFLAGCGGTKASYYAYTAPKADSEVCALLVTGGNSMAKDVGATSSGEIIAIDQIDMSSTELVPEGETAPRRLIKPANPNYYGQKDIYFGIVEKAFLLPGFHDLIIEIQSERMTGSHVPQALFDKIHLNNWNCAAGKQYSFYYISEAPIGKKAVHRIWLESEGEVVWEGIKPVWEPEWTFDLSQTSIH